MVNGAVSPEQLRLSRLNGLVVWFSLWVREAPGSNPGWAQVLTSFSPENGLLSWYFVLTLQNLGSTEIWTRIAGFRVQSANHYTTRPTDSTSPQRLQGNGWTTPSAGGARGETQWFHQTFREHHHSQTKENLPGNWPSLRQDHPDEPDTTVHIV